ncbi:hypothetical protein FJW10_27350 [Mesorhizobium sp. B4-1-1]|nr:hypothetical protein FJW10_27350 [Mesorhizobium sp. B4-1-1]
MSRKSVQRFCDNDMHENKALKARRLNPLQRDALLGRSKERSDAAQTQKLRSPGWSFILERCILRSTSRHGYSGQARV